VHATSPGYCCPQITVELGTGDDGTYTFLAEGNGPAMEECQNACVYAKDSNKTDLYCFQAVTSEEIGDGQVQCEAISPYSLLTSTTPAVTGPTAEELLKKIENLQKDLADQTKKTKDLEVELKKEVEAREAEDYSIDGRLNKTEMRTAVCGYQNYLGSTTNLTFDRVYDEVNSGGVLEESGYFTARIEGVYLVTLKTSVNLDSGEWMYGYLKLSSGPGSYTGTEEETFIYSSNRASRGIYDQASASRYVKMTAGEKLHVILDSGDNGVDVYQTIMCVSLYSASG